MERSPWLAESGADSGNEALAAEGLQAKETTLRNLFSWRPTFLLVMAGLGGVLEQAPSLRRFVAGPGGRRTSPRHPLETEARRASGLAMGGHPAALRRFLGGWGEGPAETQRVRWVLPFGRWMAAFPHRSRAGWGSGEHGRADALEGLGYYGPGPATAAGGTSCWQRGWTAIRPRRSIMGPAVEGWLAFAGIGPQHRRQHPQPTAYNLPFFRSSNGNVQRCWRRLTASPRPPQRQLAGFWQLSDSLARRRSGPRAFNQALMDLGATGLHARQLACEPLPLAGHCAA